MTSYNIVSTCCYLFPVRSRDSGVGESTGDVLSLSITARVEHSESGDKKKQRGVVCFVWVICKSKKV
jgi:hypothetical protein